MNGKLNPQGFLKAQDKILVDETGEEIFLRGMNLGNWFLPEAYMWKFPHELGKAHIIEKVFAEMIGKEKADAFWEAFYDRYTTENDIKQIAKEGYNSIRLPLNYRLFMNDDGTFIEDRMLLIDKMLDWCEAANIYVIIDLHGAPGGQTGTNIDDSKNNHPDLFTDKKNVELTVHFWKSIADKYKDRYIVAGYDLLNEPLPREHNQYNDALIEVYKEITAAIRQVDTNHIIIVECPHWGTDFRVFTEAFDDNMVIEFHKYWCPTDYRYVRDFLNLRDSLNVPLWMGEGGENNLDWLAGSFQMLEDYNISWCFWPWKKMDTLNTPCSIKVPANWDKIISHAKKEIVLDSAEAEAILNEYLDNILLENCEYHEDVINAMMRRVPFRIQAEFYGLKGENTSYFFNEKVTTSVHFRREEGANITFIIPNDNELPDYSDVRCKHGKEENSLCLTLGKGDWVNYEVNIDQNKSCTVSARLCSVTDISTLEISLNDAVIGTKEISGSDWVTETLAENIIIPQGLNQLTLKVLNGTIKADYIDIV